MPNDKRLDAELPLMSNTSFNKKKCLDVTGYRFPPSGSKAALWYAGFALSYAHLHALFCMDQVLHAGHNGLPSLAVSWQK